MWPFSKRDKKKELGLNPAIHKISVAENFVSVPSMNFFGQYSKSKNGQFLLAWSDMDTEKGIGGFRKSGEGSCILAKESTVILYGRLQRPNDGKVANNGRFILNDWIFGEGLKGIFYAFDSSGEQLIKYHFSANLFNNDIAEEGSYAVCQCANCDTEDSGVLAFFDLESRKFIWKKQPESGWADSYYFNCKKNELILIYKKRGKYRYDFSGNFIDKEKCEAERIKYASAFELTLLAQERYKQKAATLNDKNAQEILSFLYNALEKGLDEYPNEKAVVYRTIGEIKESLGKK